MIKKKAKKTTTKKSGKKSGAKGKKSAKSPAEVRKELADLVSEHATLLTSAVIEEGEKGQLAPVKFLLEMAHIFPQVNDGSESTEDEDCLAKTLLQRFNIPESPVVADEGDEFSIPPRVVEEKADAAEPTTAEAEKLEDALV